MTYPPMPVKAKKTRRPLSEMIPDLVLGLLAVAGLVISGWSLGTLLHDTAGAPWAVAVFGVAVFDLVAMAACYLVFQRREDPWAAAGARLVMMGALLASAVVNGAHGFALGGWTTAAVLAAAPLAFEVVFELRHRTLTALIWILFRKEAFTRLRTDAWTRIAIQTGPSTMSVSGSGSPKDVVDTVRQLRPAGQSGGSAKDKVREQIESGVTDPDEMVRNLPDYNSETVRRYARSMVKELGA